MASIYETHMNIVNSMIDDGEEVLQPQFGEPMNRIDGYIKNQIPSKDAGSIFVDHNGTFGLFIDMGSKIVTGIEKENLGLCDSRCWYEWMSPDTYSEQTKEIHLSIYSSDSEELFEILCAIPFEQADITDSEPPTERHPAVESLISQLSTILYGDENE